jgi:AhpD family alkylhydroperoxidase
MAQRPNIHDVLDRVPTGLDTYKAVEKGFKGGSLTEVERTTVLLAASYENGCTYCVPVYTLKGRSLGMEEAVIDALRSGGSLPDERLDALAQVTRALVANRGRLSDDLRARFANAGYREEQLIDVVLGIAQKTITNYVNALFSPELDEMFQSARWEPPR